MFHWYAKNGSLFSPSALNEIAASVTFSPVIQFTSMSGVTNFTPPAADIVVAKFGSSDVARTIPIRSMLRTTVPPAAGMDDAKLVLPGPWLLPVMTYCFGAAEREKAQTRIRDSV